MCFSEHLSYINTVILLGIAINFNFKEIRISLPAFYLALKDLLQGLFYRYYKNKEISHILGILSWIHICFQPFFVNIFISYFDKEYKYWNYIFLFLFIFGCYHMTKLSALDIQGDEDCKDEYEFNDFCAKETGAYMGNFHIAYKFKAENSPFSELYLAAMILPSFLTKTWILSLIWLFFIFLLRIIFNPYLVRNGEFSAIWCFLSIIIFIPFVYFRDYILKNYIYDFSFNFLF